MASSESDHIGVISNDTLSSRQSSTTTASSETAPKDPTVLTHGENVVEKSVIEKKPKSSKPKNRSSNNDSNNENHQLRKLSATGELVVFLICYMAYCQICHAPANLR